MTTLLEKPLTRPGNRLPGCKQIARSRSTAILGLGLLLISTSCQTKSSSHLTVTNNYIQTNLVADSAGANASKTDPNLVNAWGIATTPSGAIYISANHTGLSTVYDQAGSILRPPIIIPLPGAATGGSPTGAVFNSTSDFAMGSHTTAIIFATEDGTLATWGTGDTARIVVDRSAMNAVYKGITMATDGGQNFLYVTDFHNAKVDVFDKAFNLITSKPFMDPGIPAGFAPFNIKSIGGNLYVTYAKQKPDKHDDMAGPGNGYVNVFKTDGTFLKRFASQGTLNSPWGITAAATGFWNVDNTILVGNFGDGKIGVYSWDGGFLGQLMKGSAAISIDGLWDIESNIPAADPKRLYFTAGPVEESHGLFGYLMPGN